MSHFAVSPEKAAMRGKPFWLVFELRGREDLGRLHRDDERDERNTSQGSASSRLTGLTLPGTKAFRICTSLYRIGHIQCKPTAQVVD